MDPDCPGASTAVQHAGPGLRAGLSYQYQFGLIPKYHSVAGYLGA